MPPSKEGGPFLAAKAVRAGQRPGLRSGSCLLYRAGNDGLTADCLAHESTRVQDCRKELRATVLRVRGAVVSPNVAGKRATGEQAAHHGASVTADRHDAMASRRGEFDTLMLHVIEVGVSEGCRQVRTRVINALANLFGIFVPPVEVTMLARLNGGPLGASVSVGSARCVRIAEGTVRVRHAPRSEMRGSGRVGRCLIR